MADPDSSSSSMIIDGSDHDSILANSKFLTRQELLTRRSRRVKQLGSLYKDYYWALMEDLKYKYKEYYWKFGKSPFEEDEKKREIWNNSGEEIGENGNSSGKLGLVSDDDIMRCAVAGCKSKAMALTRFCHQHILSDAKQKLYKGCTYVVKSGQTGPVLCGKPILRSTHPSLCSIHFQKNEKHVMQALKRVGYNFSSPNKVPPDFRFIVTEYVRHIQIKRRAMQKESAAKVEIA